MLHYIKRELETVLWVPGSVVHACYAILTVRYVNPQRPPLLERDYAHLQHLQEVRLCAHVRSSIRYHH